MTDKFFCPRASENGGGPNSPYKPPFNGEASWRENGTCSYCGSLRPDAFFTAIEAGAELIPTDKSYKAYVRGEGYDHAKVYFQHFSAEDQERLITLVNTRKVKFARPGYFYVLPFFCVPATA